MAWCLVVQITCVAVLIVNTIWLMTFRIFIYAGWPNITIPLDASVAVIAFILAMICIKPWE